MFFDNELLTQAINKIHKYRHLQSDKRCRHDVTFQMLLIKLTIIVVVIDVDQLARSYT